MGKKESWKVLFFFFFFRAQLFLSLHSVLAGLGAVVSSSVHHLVVFWQQRTTPPHTHAPHNTTHRMSSSEASHQVSLSLGPGKLGLKLQELKGEHVVIHGITPGGQAETAGFKEGDLIVAIGSVNIPVGPAAYDSVVDCITGQPRPLVFKCERKGAEPGAEPATPTLTLLTDELIKSLTEEIVRAGHASPESATKVLASIREMKPEAWKELCDKVTTLVDIGVGSRPRVSQQRALQSSDVSNLESKAQDVADMGLGLTQEDANQVNAAQAKIAALQKRQQKQALKMASLTHALKMKPIATTKVTPAKSTVSINPGVLRCMRKARMSKDSARDRIKKQEDDIAAGEAIKISEEEEAKAEKEAAVQSFETHEVILTLGPGSLGMSLNEVGGTNVMVGALVEGGQAERIGLLEGDCFVNIGGAHIPKNETAYDQVIHCLTKMPRPIQIIVLREGEATEKWPPTRYSLALDTGSLGMSLQETGGDHCVISEIVAGGQAAAKGFMPCDRFIQVGTSVIPKDPSAYDVVLDALQNQPRPIQCTIERSRREVIVKLNSGSLGMSLTESPPFCMVSSVVDGGQSDTIGICGGDCFVTIGGKVVPEGEAAYDVVISYLQTLPRPVEVVMLREGADSY